MGKSETKRSAVPKVLNQWLFPKEAEELTKALDTHYKKLDSKEKNHG